MVKNLLISASIVGAAYLADNHLGFYPLGSVFIITTIVFLQLQGRR